jgi:hypothetical protein
LPPHRWPVFEQRKLALVIGQAASSVKRLEVVSAEQSSSSVRRMRARKAWTRNTVMRTTMRATEISSTANGQ